MSSGVRVVRLQPVLRRQEQQASKPDHDSRVCGWIAAAGIALALAVFIAASLARASWMTPPVPMPSAGPPFQVGGWRVQPGVVTVALWVAALAGGLGVAAGLLAVRRGARPPVPLLLAAAAVAVAALAVLPPAGSTDALDYAAFGRIVVLGHSPYVLTPYDLMRWHDAIAKSVPLEWANLPSPYGPAATGEQFLAAVLGGTSAARIVFWLKLWNAMAFGGVALVADRLLRAEPAGRLRAHLLWTVNPLLIWELIAAGHLDVLAAAAGMLGLIVACGWPAAGRATQPRLWPVLAGGALVGLAADIKISFILFGLGLALALRQWPRALAAAAVGMMAVLLPGYAWFGPAAVRAILLHGNRTSADNFYQLFSAPGGFLMRHVAVVGAVLVVAVAILALRRLPGQTTAHPAVFAALAVSAAWLFLWPYQLPSYDAMAVCLLILMPASWLDWLVVARLTAGTIALMPGNPTPVATQLAGIYHDDLTLIVPIVLLGAAVGLVALCLWPNWRAWRVLRLIPRRA
jgi:hypothetical protein